MASSVSEAAAKLAIAVQSTEQAGLTLVSLVARLARAEDLLVEALDGVTHPDAENAIGGIVTAQSVAADVIDLLGQGDDRVWQYAVEVLRINLSDAGGRGSSVTGTGDLGQGLTDPSRAANSRSRPRGLGASIRAQDNAATTRGRRRENEAALLLAKLGYDIEQTPDVPGPKEPDYRIEGKIFDAYSPETDNVHNIWKSLQKKVQARQATRFVVNLADSVADVEELRDQFHDWRISGLDEVLGVRNGRVTRMFP